MAARRRAPPRKAGGGARRAGGGARGGGGDIWRRGVGRLSGRRLGARGGREGQHGEGESNKWGHACLRHLPDPAKLSTFAWGSIAAHAPRRGSARAGAVGMRRI